MVQGIHLVWLKRDLRLEDHRPLWEACKSGPVVMLYAFEPKLWAMPEMDRSHFDFICESLKELAKEAKEIGGKVAIRVGEFPEVLKQLHAQFPIISLYSHEETGNGFTYERDKRVASWCKANDIRWIEHYQNGVVRRLKNRNGWAEIWNQRMSEPVVPRPEHMVVPSRFDWGSVPQPNEIGLGDTRKTDLQQGGSQQATEVLNSFLNSRGVDYQKAMSSPVTAPDACSRLSPYISWGCISVKSVYRQLQDRQMELRSADRRSIDPRWNRSLKSFSSRLAWHCHFMQKLEDEPELEFRNLHRLYDGLRENDFDQHRFDAWCHGRTGYPMVDACMRALHQCSWINFRMRAMLMSFASNHLWLHWRPTAVFLARHFLDFEPGIHFAQCQMQSGTTGINTVRIYSPAKQAVDHDPNGVFIRKFVPELAHVPKEFLAEPHRMPLDVQSRVGCQIGKNYPLPIVDHKHAYRNAQQRIFAIRQSQAAVIESNRVFLKHGSRKKRDALPKARQTKAIPQPKQLDLFDNFE